MRRFVPARYARFVATLSLVISGVLSGASVRAQTKEQTPPQTTTSGATKESFVAAADEVLRQVSALTQLPLRMPVKKSLRSREEIRAYVLRKMKEDKSAEERYAGERAAKAFGLLPKDFETEPFLVDLLTEQIAGLYDPEGHEFYIADWIPLDDQRMVMAHELTHALEDQHFHIEGWMKAARPNDDAELAREAVLEGSAMAAMIDFMLQGTGRSLMDLPDVDPELLVGDLGNTPTLGKAPPFIKDALVFPYFGGLRFSKAALKEKGWSGLPAIFAKPPVSSQQILHPQLYLEGKTTAPVEMPAVAQLLGSDWKRLEENAMGEFGWKEVLKQFLGNERAAPLASAWAGDRYAVYEHKQTKRLVLIARLRLAGIEETARFFGQYSEALEKKYDQRKNLFRRPNFFSFDVLEGSVFLRCVAQECLEVEGASRAIFDGIVKGMGWSAVPERPKELVKDPERIAANR